MEPPMGSCRPLKKKKKNENFPRIPRARRLIIIWFPSTFSDDQRNLEVSRTWNSEISTSDGIKKERKIILLLETNKLISKYSSKSLRVKKILKKKRLQDDADVDRYSEQYSLVSKLFYLSEIWRGLQHRSDSTDYRRRRRREFAKRGSC